MAKNNMLRTRLLGYSKSDVCETIAALSREFSREIAARDQQATEEIRRLQGKIRQLEEENKALTLREKEVVNAFLDAKSYAREIRSTAEDQQEKTQQDLLEKAGAAQFRIQELCHRIDDIQLSLRHTLSHIDKELSLRKKELEQSGDTASTLLQAEDLMRRCDDLLDHPVDTSAPIKMGWPIISMKKGGSL